MAQKTIESWIVLNGRVGNGIGAIGDKLLEIGSSINMVSEKLIDFGKEGLEVYRGYDDNMRDAQGALLATYSDLGELNEVMQGLHAHAQEWAASTIFHTSDVSAAIAEAAHAGWDYEQILYAIPAAMRVAQAGNMDLADALDDYIKIMNGTNTAFEDGEYLMDQWVYAANKAPTTVEELGEAIKSMGAVARFTDSNAELLTMLDILAEVGAVGSQAGTLLRGAMLRLIAPTDKAWETMAGMGMNAEEIEEIWGDMGSDVLSTLEGVGFSAYDSEGKLKSMTAIFAGLSSALGKMENEAERNNILAKLFPTRTTAGAMALIDAVTTADWGGRMDDIANSFGYAEEVSGIMMGGITGTIETISSKFEELQRAVGAEVAESIEGIAQPLMGLLDKVNGMDEGAFSALAAALEVIGVAGPGLIAAGWGAKALSFLWTQPGLIATAALGLTSLGVALADLSNTNFKEKFGTGQIDSKAIREYLDQITAPFNEAREQLTTYNEALDKAVGAYGNNARTLAENLRTALFTNQEITPEWEDEMLGMAESAGDAAKNAVTAAGNATKEMVLLSNNPLADDLILLIDAGMGAAIERANAKSEELKNAMTAAFKDGLSADDIADILNVQNELNALVAIQAEAENAAEAEAYMRRAQNASWESLMEISDEIMRKRDAAVEEALRERDYSANYTRGIGELSIGRTLENGTVVDEDYVNTLYQSQIEAGDAAVQRTAAMFDNLMLDMWQVSAQSAAGDTYEQQREIARLYNAGIITDSTARANAASDYTLNRILLQEIEALGGFEATMERMNTLYEIGDVDTANRLNEVLTMALLGTKTLREDADRLENPPTTQENLDAYAAYTKQMNTRYESDKYLTPEQNSARLRMIAGEGAWAYLEALFGGDYSGAQSQWLNGMNYGQRSSFMDVLRDMGLFEAWQNAMDAFAEIDYQNKNGAGGDSSMLNEAYSMRDASIAQLQEAFTSVNMGVETTGAESAAANAQQQMQQYADSHPVYYPVTVNSSGGVGNTKAKGYAEGGRADEPSIFGEAGAEWAIPEENSANTRSLMIQAAQASGISLSELAAQAEGAKAQRSAVQVYYSPVIYAENADGVDEKLREDKRRFEDWMNERERYESVVKYR